MREALDRLREAETALDNGLNDAYYTKHTAHRLRMIQLLWEAKQALWWATMHALNAAAGAVTPVPVASKPVSYESAAAAYKAGIAQPI